MKHKNDAVSRIKKHFPNVTRVVDAKDSIAVHVKKQDVTKGRRNQPGQCALAQACVREFHADGALINIGYSYIITGNKATRYKTSVAVGREITSFDRHHDFAPGADYLLSKVSDSNKLGVRTGRPGTHSQNPTPSRMATIHKTVRIRKLSKS